MARQRYTKFALFFGLTAYAFAAVKSTPSTASFGNAVVGTNIATVSLTLSNGTGFVVPVGNFSVTGDFAQTNTCGTSIAKAGSCYAQVLFVPTVNGARAGTFNFTWGAANTLVSVALTGTGVAVAPVSISISPSNPTMAVGTNGQMTALALFNDGSRQDVTALVTWSSSNVSIGSFVTTPGHMSCGSTVGATTVTVSYAGVTTATTATIVNNMVVTPRVATVTFQQTAQFHSTNPNADPTPANWFVDGVLGGTAATGTISSGGQYTPPATVGSHTITAANPNNAAFIANVTVYVTNNAGVFTYHNDSGRTGWNPSESVLTPANVNTNQFGVLFAYHVDGNIYAQPLYAQNVTMPGYGNLNVAFVETEHGSVYAFDADGNVKTPLWQTSFINPAAGIIPVPGADVNDPAITPENGITGTPVIDPVSGTLYVVAVTRENNVYFSRLHALDITTGAEKFGGPVAIQGSVPGTGDGTDGHGNVVFNPLKHRQRPGLLLLNGVVYIAFSSYDDHGPAHGWLFGYAAQTLAQVSVFATTPNGTMGGIWGAGGGLAADAVSRIFFTTGDGNYDVNGDFGDSVVQITPTAGVMTASDFFTPWNTAALNTGNLDLGSGGVLVLPPQSSGPQHLVVAAGKTGTIYLLNGDNLGGFNSGADTQIVQELPNAVGPMYSTPAYFQATVNGAPVQYVYFQGSFGTMKVYQLSTGQLTLVQSGTTSGWPGATPSISSNGGANGVIWKTSASSSSCCSGEVLLAYDALKTGKQLYASNSAVTKGRDGAGNYIKFSVPTIANGKAFLGSQTELTVYGLLP